MPVRGLSPDQFFDCLSLATENRTAPAAPPDKKKKKANPAQIREQFLDLFRSEDHVTETQTSVLQALHLMNGPFIAERTQQAAAQIMAMENASTRQRVEALYISVLSRFPRPAESAKMVKYIDDNSDARQAITDMCWVLLNSSEFMVNH
jgi:hypothetical protein